MTKKISFVFASFIFFFSCNPYEGSFELVEDEKSIAIPLVYGNLSIDDVIERAKGDARIRIDGDGRITALYSGELLRENAAKIFPPVPGIFEFPLTDNSVEVPLPINASYRIDKGIFDNTNIYFRVVHKTPEIITLRMKIPSVTKDGSQWQKEYTLDFTNSSEVLTSTSNLKSWTAIPNSNKIKFEYEAIRPNGETIKLNTIAMKFDVLAFAYLDGYFGNHRFDIKGDVIKINIFDQWKSGGIEFENPIIKMDVDNAFGFPVRSKVNQLVLQTINNELFNVESEYIDKGIDFNYPTINEIGQLKNTQFQFDKNNSNVGQIFKEKVTQVIYDFDALANPDGDIGLKNFFNTDAYFSVKVDVELPLKIKSNFFTIADTFDVNLADYNNVQSAEVKFNIVNNFPMDMLVKANFLDANGVVLESLIEKEFITIKAASIGSDGKTTNKVENETIVNMDAARFEKIKKAKRVMLTASFDTSTPYSTPIWFYSNYGLDVKIGAKINIK